MKYKYFLRGLGIGILFASIIFLAAYQGKASNKITDAEIIKRAKDLGMVEKEDPLKDLMTTEHSSAEDSSVSEKKGTTENTTKESTNKNTTKSSTEQDNETEKEEKNTESNTVNQTTTEQAKEVTVTVERGSSSYPVCQKLQDLGIIKNAEEFDTYLVEKGYASRIRVGTHTLKMGMSFNEIAEAISDPM